MLGLILNKMMGVRTDPLDEQRERLRTQVRRLAEIDLRNATARAASRLEQLAANGVPFHAPPAVSPAPRPNSFHPVYIYEKDEATGYPFKPAVRFEQDPLFGWLDGFGFGFPDMDLSSQFPVSSFPREMFPERPTTLRTQIAQDAVRFQSRAWFETIPQYSGPIGHLVNYVVGGGMEIDVVPCEQDEDAEEVAYEQDDETPAASAASKGESEPGQEKDAADPDDLLAASVQKWIDAFAKYEHNRLLERVAESVINLLRDGEDALRVYPGKEFPAVRSIDTSTIRGPHNEIYGPWAYGVLTSWPRDFEDVKAFHLWHPDNSHEDVSPELMSLVKLETTGSNVKRGVPMAYAARKQLPQMQKLLDCMAVGEAARQAIPYIRQFNLADRAAVRSATPSSLDSWDVARQEYNAAIGERDENAIRPGEVPLINKGQEFVETPQGRAESGALAYRTLCESLATCWQVPIWFITGSADSENYASSLVSESPVVKKITRLQNKICGHYEAICKAVLTLAIKAGKFPADTLERVEVHCELPTPAVRDPDKAIDSDIKLLDKKLLSPQHLCARNDLDFEEETDLIQQAEQQGWQAQTEMELAQADQLAKQGGDGDGPEPSRFQQNYEQQDTADGRWITIGGDEDEGGGCHVFIEPGGKITKGPKSLTGKNIRHLHDHLPAADQKALEFDKAKQKKSRPAKRAPARQFTRLQRSMT